MLITVELLMRDNMCHSILTVGELLMDELPAQEPVVVHYTDKYATMPPGLQVRKHRGDASG
ncbi:TPA: hypothetical protein P5S08_002470 [Salmonella enterica subsp. enterica serovar Concord]|nr:hypothetical protein [Salmonella enterica subsp. enterica serovar Concord]